MTSIALPPEIAILAITFAGMGVAAPVDTAIERLRSLARIRGDGLSKVMGRAIVLPITTFFASTAGLIVAAFDVPITTLDSLGRNLGNLVDAIIGVPAAIITRGGQVSMQNLAIFGVLAFLVALALVYVGFFMFAKFREEDETSNVFPGLADLPSWFPGIGAEEEGGD